MARFALLSTGLLALGVSLWAAADGTGPGPAPAPGAWRAETPHFASLSTSAPTLPRSASAEIIQSYCVACHNDAALTGNLSLQGFDPALAERTPETAERVIRKLAAGMMPPPGMPRPGGDTLVQLRRQIEERIDRTASRSPNPGQRTFQRLNRPEYEGSIRELLGLDISAGDYLPLDTKSANFDNIADVQTPSAMAIEGFIRAADAISRIAVGDPNAAPTSVTYRVAKTASQMEHVEGAPLGTRGGLSAIHNFPADGEYVFQVMLHPGPTGFLFGLTAVGEQIEISVDGERAALLDIDRWMSEEDPEGMRISTKPIAVRAGPHRVSAAFLKRFEGSVDDLITPIQHTLADTQIGNGYGVTTLPHLRDMSLVGPYNVTGVSDNPTRRRIFTCRPLSAAEEEACAREIVGRLATQAYRRPLGEDDMTDLMGFYRVGAEKGFEEGIRVALHSILASPHFLFRIEEGARPGAVSRIADVDLASRLSFFLWGLPPDAELLDLARRGRLSDTGTLERQARRLLADPRSEGLATRFAAQWLRLQDLDKVHPDALSFPYYDARLADAMMRETELFFLNLVREDRNVLELLTADYTFVNDRLAAHYGIPGVSGPEFRRVSYPDETRRGLLGHGSVLTLTSHADRTSPVLRGKWVMEVILGTPPPPPPPNVPDLAATQGSVEGRLLTTRQRMEIHRANPTCNACHQFMDPIGLALDNFEVTGAWRIKENGAALDTRGNLYDGTPVSSPAELREALLRRPEPIVRNFTANLLAYALARRVEWYDMPTVRRIVRDASENDYALSSFILGVVKSDAFRRTLAPQAADADGR
jgi:mono/diheme cytochrome c family protein